MISKSVRAKRRRNAILYQKIKSIEFDTIKDEYDRPLYRALVPRPPGAGSAFYSYSAVHAYRKAIKFCWAYARTRPYIGGPT